MHKSLSIKDSTPYNQAFLVFIRCSTYNHKDYIEKAMDRFAIQQTSFPFVAAIMDDASTDGTRDIVEQYFLENFNTKESGVAFEEEHEYGRLLFARHKKNNNCFFVLLLLKENLYSKGRHNEKMIYIEPWAKSAKYHALCEGDDYWISSTKLQQQIDILEKNDNFSMVCSCARLYSERLQKYNGMQRCREGDGILNPSEVIRNGGLYIATCTLVFRTNLWCDEPDYCQNCHVGDYPLQILGAMSGGIYYIDSPMAVYRVDNPSSWIGQLSRHKLTKKRLDGIESEIRMLQAFAKEYPVYKEDFEARINYFLKINIPYYLHDPNGFKEYIKRFKTEINGFDKKMKLKVFIKHSIISFLPYQLFAKIKHQIVSFFKKGIDVIF